MSVSNDQISLTDLRRQFFGPTLDESVLYGVDCLRDLFCGNQDNVPRSSSSRERRNSSRIASDLHMYQSCRDVSLRDSEKALVPKKEHGHMGKVSVSRMVKKSKSSSLSSKSSKAQKKKSSSDEHHQNNKLALIGNLKEEVKRSSLTSSGNTEEYVSSTSTEEKISRESSKAEKTSEKKGSSESSSITKESSKPSHLEKLSSSSEQSRKTKSSSNGSSKILEKLKKDLANSFIYETKTSPPSAPTTRGRHTPRTVRHSTLRSSSLPPPKAPANDRRPKQIRTRWAFVKVNEFDDGANTYDVLRTDLQVVDVERLKDSLGGTIAAADLPPEAPTEIVFVALPDGSSLCYRGKHIKR
nr:LOW QUALITY PROTEIN: cell wall integrity and stress response component 3-like [Aedes albopictus]